MQVLIGRITSDATINKVNDNKQVVNFSIALNHRFKNKDGEQTEITTFVNCAYWRNTTIAAYLKKGTLVEVAGHLSANAYNDLNGNAKAIINFHTSEITFHGKSKESEASPQPDKKGKRKPAHNSGETVAQTAAAAESIDDLPF